VALVYEWRAPTDEVAVTLSSSEFIERRGTSLTGEFVTVDDAVRETEAGSMTEPWSREILRHLRNPGWQS
jgi:hypothetical protein